MSLALLDRIAGVVGLEDCARCLVSVGNGNPVLCRPCEKYAGQDHVSQKELLLPDWLLEKLATRATHADVIGSARGGLDGFYRLLGRGCLSRQQRQVLVLRFTENMAFSEIGQKLGVSKQLAAKQFGFAIKKPVFLCTGPNIGCSADDRGFNFQLPI